MMNGPEKSRRDWSKMTSVLTIGSGSGYDILLVKHFCAKFVCARWRR
jgi:hypothetical protein